ncbi:MAG: hypothetical protein ABSG68_23590 [Thermoguttaceae bacterium]|jgi:hypothetical protein
MPKTRKNRPALSDEVVTDPAGRRRRKLMLTLVPAVLCTLLWLLPSIVVHTPLLDWGMRAATADFDAQFTIESTSLGWFSPITANGITIHDMHRQQVFQAASLTSEKSLWHVIWNRSSLGKIRLEQPKLTVVLRNGGSNLEDVLARFFRAPKRSGDADFLLEVLDGNVTVVDQETRQTWQIDKLQLAAAKSPDPGRASLEGSAELSDAQHPGRLAWKLDAQQPPVKTAKPGPAPLPPGAGKLHLEAEGVPLAMFERLLARFAPPTRLNGRISTKIDAQWGNETDGAAAAFQADVMAQDLQLTVPGQPTWTEPCVTLLGSGRWAGGALQFDRLDATLGDNQGRLVLAPRVQFTPEPAELTLPAGPLAQRVQIDPTMCQAALKYVAPVLAEVTAAQGSVSLELQGCRVPLADPSKCEAAGRLTVHAMQIGPGPLVRELALLTAGTSSARLRPESQISFRVADGRVYHQGLEVQLPGLSLRTSGWVAFDQTLSVVAEMPLPAKWSLGGAAAGTQPGQTIQLPIGGTLKRPQLDRGALAKASRQFLGNAARNVIGNEVHKGLERLFGTPPSAR